MSLSNGDAMSTGVSRMGARGSMNCAFLKRCGQSMIFLGDEVVACGGETSNGGGSGMAGDCNLAFLGHGQGRGEFQDGGYGHGDKRLEADVALGAMDASSKSSCALLCVPNHSESRGPIST
jgi:hypothetical protein